MEKEDLQSYRRLYMMGKAREKENEAEYGSVCITSLKSHCGSLQLTFSHKATGLRHLHTEHGFACHSELF